MYIYAFVCQNYTVQSQVKRADIVVVMRELGADWDEEELVDALEALDPSDSGTVEFSDFLAWWSN